MTTEDMMWDDYDYYRNTGEPEDWFEDESEGEEYESDGEYESERKYDEEYSSIEDYIAHISDKKLDKLRYRKK